MATDQYVQFDYMGSTVSIDATKGGDSIRVGRYNSIMRGPVVAITVYNDDDNITAQVWLDRAAAIKLATAALNTALECEAHVPAFDANV